MRARRFVSREARTLAVVTGVVLVGALLLFAYGAVTQAFPPPAEDGANLGPGIGYVVGILVLVSAVVLALLTALVEARAQRRLARRPTPAGSLPR